MSRKAFVVIHEEIPYVFDIKRKAKAFVEQDTNGEGKLIEGWDYTERKRMVNRIEKEIEEYEEKLYDN